MAAEPVLHVTDVGRKQRGAFFTPPAIATFLSRWALNGRRDAIVLDPTCGEGVFLLAAGRHLRELGSSESALDAQVFGVDIHEPSLRATSEMLAHQGLDAHL